MKNRESILDPKFINNIKENRVLEEKYLASYLTGFLESDGTIYVPKEDKKSHICISFAFSKDDLPFAEFLKAKFNMGSVKSKKNEFSCNWTINKESEILQLLTFCNGYFRTPKIGALAKGIEYYNNKHNLNIPVLPLCSSSILEDAWFAGFSEGDSSFQISFNKKPNYSYISLTPTYALEVSENYSKEIDTTLSSQSNRDFMTTISNTFNVNLTTFNRKATAAYKETSSIKCRLTREDNLNQLINYFYTFPLFSSKYLNFIDWVTIILKKIELKQLKERISDHYLELKKISDGMNSKRTFYNWKHLESFYKLPINFPKAIELKFKNGRKS